MRVYIYPVLFTFCLIFFSCNNREQTSSDLIQNQELDSIPSPKQEKKIPLKAAEDVLLKKQLLYDQYTLEDSYPYQDTTRVFQWQKIKEKLAYIENFQNEQITYAVLQNYKNKNGEAPPVKNFVRNDYTRVSDTLGTERYQSVPLYVIGETQTPTLYGRDGFIVSLLSNDTLDMVRIKGISMSGEWDVPKRYIKKLGDSIRFNHIVVIDVTHQNAATIERKDDQWYIRSMNPATSGVHKPPYAQETPTGIFLIQENKPKMFYYKDGTTDIAGYAPYASRFTNGAYLHGVPTNDPKASIIEYSRTLGTIPRSHMCVRLASSHAKFIYEWAKPLEALVIVID